MQRSRTQIARSYAPGALFTYEGGLGCCVSVPISAPVTPSSPAVQRQLFEHLQEYVESWLQRGLNCRATPSVLPEQCVDGAFLDFKNEPIADPGKFVLTQPSRIGFVPDPLVFVCSDCSKIVEFNSLEDLALRWPNTELREDCLSENKRHKWRQIDVVFAHWSGNYCGLSPHRWVMGPDGNTHQLKKCQNCDHEEYKLITKSSPSMSDWRFQCVNCLTPKDVVQADRDTLKLLKPGMDSGLGNLPKEWNMLPVSYRASSVFYAQTDSFIVFKDPEITTLLAVSRRPDLIARLMTLYNFPGTILSNDEIVKQLKDNGHPDKAKTYQDLMSILSVIPSEMKKTIEGQLYDARLKYEADGLIAKQHHQSPLLVKQIEDHQDWARRYNPIRLAVEHISLRSEIIERQGSDPSLPAISVLNPEVCDIDKNNIKERNDYIETTKAKIQKLGLDELILLRGLDICEFSFGFTRVGSTPSINVKDREMPVCLKAFDYAEKGKRPIYVLEQKNEGFYVRLNEDRVVSWLAQNGLGASLPPREGMSLGGLIIEEYDDFGRFLEDYRERTTEDRTPRSISNYTYMLLHTMAHHFAHAIVEYSGLEHGSIGEYIFPADLSFLIYRRGMTPDLGNLSAMWRNNGLNLLDQLLWDRALKCDGGSLCDQRGGACPACIMAPDVVCIGGNNLLSRASLNGGPPPGWDLDRSPLKGFFRLSENKE
ncbi:MAG: hypothetical protein WBK55_09650 [Alphaproteobacteria bacterium]